MNTDHLDRIRELSASLEIPDSKVFSPSVKQYAAITGHVLAWAIHWQEEFAIMHIFLSEGTRIKPHFRYEKEWITVISGEMTIVIDNKETVVVQPQGYIVLEPQTPHEVSSRIDTYVVSITMPASLDLPRH
jgi:quercetin dioxygenase-like cupin family protein